MKERESGILLFGYIIPDDSGIVDHVVYVQYYQLSICLLVYFNQVRHLLFAFLAVDAGENYQHCLASKIAYAEVLAIDAFKSKVRGFIAHLWDFSCTTASH